MKGVKHYLRNGTVHNGGMHKMENGTLHTGKIHTKTSKPLFHLKELSKTAKAKARRSQMAKPPGLYANIHAKRKRIKAGSKERMNKVGSKNAPTAKAFKLAAKTAKKPKKKRV